MLQKQTHLEKIDGLTGLRAISAYWVLSMHFLNGTDFIKIPYFHNGFCGVSIFFVLSGFILHYNYRNYFKKNEFLNFIYYLCLRIARIYPVHLVMLLVYIFLFIPFKLPFTVTNDTFFTFILNIFLLHGWGFTDSLSWNQPSWSISIEFFAYLLLPIFLFNIQKLPKLFLASIVIGIICIDPYTSQQLMGFSYGHRLLKYTLLFIGGVYIYELSRTIVPHLIWDFVFLLALGTLIYESHFPYPIFIKSIPATASFFALICLMNKGTKLTQWIFGNKILVYLGVTSYSLYLCHLPVMFYCRFKWNLTIIPLLIITQIMASLLYHFIEEPSRKLIRNLAKSKLSVIKHQTNALTAPI